MLMGAITLDAEWHEQVLGRSAQAALSRRSGRGALRLEELIFARWVMVVVNFERLLYEDPSRDPTRRGTWCRSINAQQARRP